MRKNFRLWPAAGLRPVFSLWLLLSLWAFFLSGCGPSNETESRQTALLSEENPDKAFMAVLPSTVKIEGETGYGSGSIYEISEEEMIIVTNRHVLAQPSDEWNVVFYQGLCAGGRVLFLSERADVGFLSVDVRGLSKEGVSKLRSVRKSEEAFEALEKNTCFFMPDVSSDEKTPVYYEGTVLEKEKYLADYEREMLYGDGIAKEGMSGCGIFDFRGNYIAMLSGGTDYREIAGVPVSVIEEEWRRYAEGGGAVQIK